MSADMYPVEWHELKRYYKVVCTHCNYTIRCETEKQCKEIIDMHNFNTIREHWKFMVYRSKDRPPPAPQRVIHAVTTTYFDVEQEEIDK